MIGSAVISGDIGPGLATGADVALDNITKVELDLFHEVCKVYHAGRITTFSLVGITDLTTTISGVTGSAVTFVID